MPVENLEKLRNAVKGKKIILFGPPGCGKGNRAKDLAALGLIHVSSGIALRAKVRDDPDSVISQKASAFMKSGELVSDEIVVPIVMEHLNGAECREKGVVLDGFPRTRAQADILFSEVIIDLVLHLDVPRKHLTYGVVQGARRACVNCAAGYSDFDPPREEGVCDRCGGKIVRRGDDNTETIENRLKLYDEETKSFLPDLERRGIVHILPITVNDDEEVDDARLKKLKSGVYKVETDRGARLRMLNLEGMRERLYIFLSDKFIAE